VDANTHPYISTGLKENKFGIAIERAPAVYARAAQLPSLAIKGLDCHIGSQLTQLTPFLDALDRLLLLVDELAASGITISHLDLGGGLGVTYRNETPPPVADYMAAIKTKLGDRKLSLMFEPGRSISANSGVLLTKVMFLKPTEHKNFAVIDAAMNDNIRPSLYQAWQDIRPVKSRPVKPRVGDAKKWDLVGPICETGDFLGKDRELAIEAGDLLAVMSTGAYGFSMSSNYNTRGRAAEVVVDGDQIHLARARETFEDMIRGEALLPE
jgi:diaminopimelate decarboxylase